MARKRINKTIETEVLVRSKRRCCLCWFYNNDDSMKQGQIAHIDQNSENNACSNLVYLCLSHHDLYDSKTSQSKGVTEGELRHAISELDKKLGNALEDEVNVQLKIFGMKLNELDVSALEKSIYEAIGDHEIVKISPGSVIVDLKILAKQSIELARYLSESKLLGQDASIENIDFGKVERLKTREGFERTICAHLFSPQHLHELVNRPDKSELRNKNLGEYKITTSLVGKNDPYFAIIVCDTDNSVFAAFRHYDNGNVSRDASPSTILKSFLDSHGLKLLFPDGSTSLFIENYHIPIKPIWNQFTYQHFINDFLFGRRVSEESAIANDFSMLHRFPTEVIVALAFSVNTTTYGRVLLKKKLKVPRSFID